MGITLSKNESLLNMKFSDNSLYFGLTISSVIVLISFCGCMASKFHTKCFLLLFSILTFVAIFSCLVVGVILVL
jgi:hypothetical protein